MCLHVLSSCRNVVYIRKVISRYTKNVYDIDKYVAEITVRIMGRRLCRVQTLRSMEWLYRRRL